MALILLIKMEMGLLLVGWLVVMLRPNAKRSSAGCGSLCLLVRWLLDHELVETVCFEYHAEEYKDAFEDDMSAVVHG
jgi:hypothetical protein